MTNKETASKYHAIGMDFSAFLAGAILVPAFAPFSKPIFAILSLVLLLVILLNSSSLWQFFRRGWLFGLGFYALALHWMFVVANYVPANFAPVILLIHIGIILILCFFPAITSLLVYPFRRLGNGVFLAAFPFAWIIMEWPRAWLWTGLPIYQLSHAFVDTPLSGFAPIGGELLMTLGVAGIAASCTAFFVLHNVYQRILAALCIVGIWGGGIVTNSIHWTSPSNEVLVRLVHGVPDQSQKFKRYYVTDTIKTYLSYSQALPRPDLIVWPESSIAGNFREFSKQLQQGTRNIAEQDIPLLLGTYVHDGEKSYNALISAHDPSVQYFKRHLIPFGEYTPDWSLIDLSKLLPGTEINALSPGTAEQPVLKMGDIAASPLICYEILFPDELRQTGMNANVMVFIADLFWFKGTWGIDQIFELARLRAKESGKPMLNATSYGITSIIDSSGQAVKRVDKEASTQWIDGNVMLMEGTTPYTRYGNSVLLISAIFVILMLYARLYATKAPQTIESQNTLK